MFVRENIPCFNSKPFDVWKSSLSKNLNIWGETRGRGEPVKESFQKECPKYLQLKMHEEMRSD